ncbi:MAG: copper-translocating P-type ATPase [Proteobacteria bacterium]|nr:copper-translocating P-type ATPase [Pseudomonadota bacterium]
MHVNIKQQGPGICPICGMALEPENVLVNQLDENSELKDMMQRFWISCIFSLPLLILTMGSHIIPIRWTQTFSMPWIELIFSTPVVLWCGWPFFKRAILSIQNRSLNMFTLIGMGVGSAYLYSLFITLFSVSFHNFGLKTTLNVYFETAALIITFVLLGQIFELKARSKTNLAIQKLLQLSPSIAHLVKNDGTEEDVPLSSIEIGNILRVLPGDKIPTDGIIIEGESSIDESMITGESLPLFKSVNAHVVGGTLNGLGSFLMRTERVGENTLLAQIIQLVSKAQRTRVPIERLVDTISQYFIFLVIFMAFLSAFMWGIFGPEPKIGYALLSALSVLIIACPCALGLATPLSIMVGIGRGALEGILIKNAEVLETFNKTDTLIFDKTGTLTVGKPQLISVVPASTSMSKLEILSYAASLEKKSEHPLAKTIIEAANHEKATLLPLTNFKLIPGRGLTGTLQNKKVSLGNGEMMQHLGINLSNFLDRITKEQKKGHTLIFLAIEKTLAGFLSVADVMKDHTSTIIKILENEGLDVIMLTGDHSITAHAIAKEAGIKTVLAGVLPKQKYDFITQLQNEGKKVAMVGDGINDAPALSQADVGIAMGTGSNIAIESADITLMSSDLKGIIKAKKLSKDMMLNIKQNLFLAFIYNGLSIPIAAGILYPFFGLLLNPMLASIVMGLSSVSVILNALRISKSK